MDSEFPEIESAAKQLRKEWETPYLWPRIQTSFTAEQQRPRRRWQWPAIAAFAATCLLAVAFTVGKPAKKPSVVAGQPLLTQQALSELEKAETAYVQSIDRLAKLVEPQLSKTGSPLMAGYREKLALLDAAIVELRIEAGANPYHPGLHMQLSTLYRDKQSTLQEVLTHAGDAR
jgi:hypothetical protein